MRHASRFLGLLLLLLSVACTSSRPSANVPSDASPSALPSPSTSTVAEPSPALSPSAEATEAVSDDQIIIHADGPSQPFDPRLLGTNVPAWLGADTLDDPTFQAQVAALGSSVVRLPGGSWSNAYSWLGCEQADEDACFWPWAAKPSDFLRFARDTNQQVMWTVSINGTAQEAAALVAFFNGQVDDETVIGPDRLGRDWETVGHWAELRAEQGSPEPLPILLWEVGNEVYGGKENSGKDCAAWGWEDVWTCDGTEYINGTGSGSDHHDGYLAFREAMRAVDPDILVGAVGVPRPSDWSDWGNEVIAAAGDQLDFYVIHHYAYDQQPPNAQSILERPQRVWSSIMRTTNEAFDTLANGRRVPVAVTEYNLVAFQELDTNQLMTRAANALFIADTIGQLAINGVSMANQWDLANGQAENGTDYGLINATTGMRYPQYYAMYLWSRFGNEILTVDSGFAAETVLSVYAGRTADGALTLLAINKTDQPITASIRIAGQAGSLQGSASVLSAESLDATAMEFNGLSEPAVDLSDAPAQQLGSLTDEFAYTFSPYSITLLNLTNE